MPQQPPPLVDETVRLTERVPDDSTRPPDDDAAVETVRFGGIGGLRAPTVPRPAPAPADGSVDAPHIPELDETARLGGGSALPTVTRADRTPAPAADDTCPVPTDLASAEPEASFSPAPAAEPPVAPPTAEPPAAPPAGDGPGARPWWRSRAVLVPAAAVAVLAGAYGLDLLIAGGDIPRHTVVAGVDIGGLSPSAAATELQHRLAPQLAAQRTVVADDVRATISPTAAGLTLDVRRTVDAADEQPLNPWTRLVTLLRDRPVAPVVATDVAALTANLDTVAQGVDHAPVDANIAIEGTTAHVTPPADGRTLDRRAAGTAITAALAANQSPSRAIRLPVRVAHPHVSTTTAQRVLDETVTPALGAPVDLVGQDGGHRTQIPVTAIAASLTFTPKTDGTLAVAIDPAKLQAALPSQFAVFGTAAKDARFEVTGDAVHVVPSVDGSGVDPAALAQQLLPVLKQTGQRTVTAQLGPVHAAFTTEQAQALGVTEKVSSFTTNFAMSPSATNIRVVAAKVNGALVRPGETFSLNDFTGPRGSAQGYIPAPVIEGGQLTNAVGGGISQFATTMFNAVFFAGLQDVHHQTHSFYISRYPAGREATVFDGLIDLSWKNDSNTGIYVQTQWTTSSITVTFWGTKHYDIESVSSEKRNITQPAVVEKPADASCIPMAGAQGFDITVTRVFHDRPSGRVLKREDFRTHYVPEAILHCVPPAAPPGPGG
jgi:vancomycin resistance protein YoaR